MITQVAQLTWKINNNTPACMIPQIMENLAKDGARFLIHGNGYYDVQSAVKNKEILNMYVNKAMDNYSKYCASDNEYMIYWRMTQDLYQAGFYYRLYLRDTGASDSSEDFGIEIPEFILTHPEFKEFWDRGFSS